MIPAGSLGPLNRRHFVTSKAAFHTVATATRQEATTAVTATLLHHKGRGVFCWKDSYEQVFGANSVLFWLFTTAETEVPTFLDICPKRSGTLTQLDPG